jgi:glycosyltransferase involved in cell wall biosynthesis
MTTFLQGGAGLAIAELASSQAALGHDVTVIASETGAPGYGNYPAHLDALARANVPVVLVDSSFKRDLAQNAEVVRTVLGLSGDNGFDLIHTHAATPSLIALIAAGRSARRPPILQTMHGWGMAKSAADAQADVAILNLLDRVVVPAESSALLLRSLGVRRAPISVVPYGVRDDVPNPSSTADALLDELRQWRANGGRVLCCLGTIGERKNQQLVIKALQRIEQRDRLLVVFVGDGDAAGLREQAAAAGVANSIRVAGYREDTRSFLATSDAFVLPSLSEGQPLSILEAWREGLPVIVSDIPELRELVDDGVTGFLFDPRCARALASAIAEAGRLSPAARLRMATRVRRLYDTRFAAADMVAGYMNEYAAVAA